MQKNILAHMGYIAAKPFVQPPETFLFPLANYIITLCNRIYIHKFSGNMHKMILLLLKF